MKNSITVTAPMANGEVAVFKVIPTGSLDQLASDLEYVVSPQCIHDLEEMGSLKIV